MSFPSEADLKQLIEDVIKKAQSKGASQVDASFSVELGLQSTARMGNVETIEHNNDRGLGLTVYFGQRRGSASTSDIKPEALDETVDAACRIAKYTAEDEYSGLPEKDDLAWEYEDLDLYHPWEIDAEKGIELALQCEDAARAEDSRIQNSEGATLSSHQGMHIQGNSHGFIGGFKTSRHSVSVSVIAQEGEDMQRDYWYTVSRDAQQLEDLNDVGKVAAMRSLRRLHSKKLSTQKLPVIFQNDIAAGLIGHFVGAIRGGSLYRRSSFLLDSLNTQIFPRWMQIVERPHIKKALGSTPFDREGVKTNKRDLVKDGVLQSYVLDTYSARRLSLHTTGNSGGVHNLSVKPTDKNLEALIKDMGKGLLVTELMGQGVNGVTGDYSRGAAGFWVEHGEIQYAVSEITIAGNLKDMYMGIEAVANDIDHRKNILTGSILIKEMTIAGN